MWRTSFILDTKFHSKISMVSTLYQLWDWILVRNNGVFTADVAEYVGLISASSSARRHFIQHHSPAKEKYQLVKYIYIYVYIINKTKKCTKLHVAISQQVDLIEQNQCHFWNRHIKLVPNQLENLRPFFGCYYFCIYVYGL